MIVYHATDPARVEVIRQEGLRVNQLPNYTNGNWLRDYYPCVPIFVSLDSGVYEGHEFMIQVSPSQLVADLGSLIDKGAYLEQGSVWFEVGDRVPNLRDFDESLEYPMRSLLTPGSSLAAAAIADTRSAVLLCDIPLDQLG